jgi:hypothetical protein
MKQLPKETRPEKAGNPGGKSKAKRSKPKPAKNMETVDLRPNKQPSSEIDPQRSEIIDTPTPILPADSQALKQPTEQMEVHHHPEVEKKGLKEYLLEGLMIFIAVMMGFFAESLREHITENNRAQEYAATLKSDLKLDTAELNDYLAYFKNAKANVDTLMKLLADNEPEKVPSGKLYWFGLYGGAYHIFTSHNATLLEMKNSGSLRFFGDTAIKRKLALYDALCEYMKTADDKENGVYTEVRKTRAHLFEFKYNDILNNISHIKNLKKQRKEIDSFQKTTPPLLSYDKTTFNEYVELVRSRFFDRKIMYADSLLHSANKLIGLLNEKYRLENE